MTTRLKIIIKKIFFFIQIIVLYLCIWLFRPFVKTKKGWVVGTDEIAGLIFQISRILKPSVSVSFRLHSYYRLKYDYSLNFSNKYLSYLIRIIYGPILLAYLVNKYTHFFYIWHTGFLLNRDFEFKFLKAKRKKLVCLFVGDDIRSPYLLQNYGKQMDIDVWGTYYFLFDESYENDKKQIAHSADNNADVIFGSNIDQLSYLKRSQLPWMYYYDNNKFFRNDNKFNNIELIKILHAPSSPINKGTPLVRSAIKKLKIEGYNFEYIELQDISNELVLENLRTSHIVLNQFYAFAIGVFGIEAMANHCAVLMSADPSIETGLPQDSKDAWMITKYWEVYDNLKYLLDNPEKIKYYADNGYEFAYKHYTYEAASEYINKVLKENGVIN
ncbi:glycosyltransferase [Arcobacter caeni]|uniref:Glycosyl transferase family 1 domain-containing protein n=1 Tax=Arcobacter caeni TaxID=1912877 RepID=A0A363CXJ2_9BACT|nr:glycosyltransferase [Arcobacter caeni]PUE63762.1 hypothetical protein B0174_09445 [Arcobacter caeni]